MAHPRPLVVYALGVFAVFLLIWMLMEQDKVTECNKLLSDQPRTENELSETSIKKLTNAILSKMPRSDSGRNETGFTDKWDYNWDKLV